MKKYLIHIFSFLLLLFVLGNGIAYIANLQLGKSDFYKTSYVAHLPSKEYDFIISGSSRGLTTLDTRMIGSALQLEGFNLSMDDTGLPSQFLMIRHFFESGNTASTCVLTLDLGHMEQSEAGINDNDYRFVPFANRAYVMDYFQYREEGIVRPLSMSGYFPLLAYSYYNMELFYPAIISLARPAYKNRFDEKGDYSYPEVSNLNLLAENKDYNPTLSNPLLEDLETYLSSKGCKLVIYIAPYFGVKVSPSNPKGYQVINHSAMLSESMYFFDKDHVTTEGKKQATQVFIPEFEKALGVGTK